MKKQPLPLGYGMALGIACLVSIGAMEQLRISGDLIHQLTALTAWQDVLPPLAGILGLILLVHGLSTLKVCLLERSITQTSRRLWEQLTHQIQDVHYQILEQTGKSDTKSIGIIFMQSLRKNIRP